MDARRATKSSRETFLSQMITCFNQNINRLKPGYHYTEDVKLCSACTRMLSGKLAYETFKANVQHAVPSVSSVGRYISQKKSKVVEGVLRTDELLEYLNDLKLPKIVVLSEDATRITNRIQYDPETNQLVGFVLPLGTNGMPIADYNKARSAADMEKCFYNVKTGKEKKLRRC